VLPSLALLAALAASPAPPSDLEPQRAELRAAAMAMEPCPRLGTLLARLNEQLDATPTPDGFALFGDLLRVAAQAGCPPPREASARHVAEAKRLAPDAGTAAGGPSWNGTLLQNGGEARLARAKSALAAGDPFAARRELVLLHADAVQSAMALVDPDAEAAAWRELKRRQPRVTVQADATTPEAALRSLERAAIALDRKAFSALLAPRSPARAALERDDSGDMCGQYRDDASVALPCLLLELLPEAPGRIACTQGADGKEAHCDVAGRDTRQTVRLVREGIWRLAPPREL
jgi:hypothetical protein